MFTTLRRLIETFSFLGIIALIEAGCFSLRTPSSYAIWHKNGKITFLKERPAVTVTSDSIGEIIRITKVF